MTQLVLQRLTQAARNPSNNQEFDHCSHLDQVGPMWHVEHMDPLLSLPGFVEDQMVHQALWLRSLDGWGN